MKKLFSILTAAAVAGMLAISAAAADFGKTTVLGDSIATGFGLSGYVSGDNYSAAESFGSKISADSAEYVNLAVDGRTTDELLAALRGEWAGSEDISACDSVVISIGGNDFLRPMFAAIQTELISDAELLAQITSGDFDASTLDEAALMKRFSEAVIAAVGAVDTAQTAANLDGITGEIKAANPDCDIFILTVYNPFEGIEGMEDFSALAEEKLGELNGAIRSLGGVTVIDAYSAFKGHAADYTNILSGDIHPSSAGHAVIYSLLCAAADGTAVPAAAPAGTQKSSPDTGAEGIAAALGTAALAGALLLVFGRKR